MPPGIVPSHEKWLKYIGIPLFMLAQWLGLQYYNQPLTWKYVWQNGLTLIQVVIHWEFIRLSMHFFRERFPTYQQILHRVLLTILVSGLFGMVLTTFLQNAISIFGGNIPLTLGLFLIHFGPMFFFAALVVGAYEVVYNFYELRRIEKEKEQLQKAHLQSQLDTLKSQVNPHFLFNSLNTLLALIPTSPKKAEQFVEELSSVYRYLLQTNEKELTPLRQEIDFVHSYFHLLKTRYETAIHLDLNIAEPLLDYQLPSLTLQLLLENAVKHNIISPSQPLTIEIFTLDYLEAKDKLPQLIVRNNLQRKIQPVASNQMGLSNILSKYKILQQTDVTISDAEGYFTVTLPLFKNTIL